MLDHVMGGSRRPRLRIYGRWEAGRGGEGDEAALQTRVQVREGDAGPEGREGDRAQALWG